MTPRAQLLVLLAILIVAAALRLPGLDRIPNGLIPDEALSAYDAFSIVKTGRDAYGERLPLFPQSTARLQCMNMYLVVPFVALHGLDEWSARLPSALAGTFTVALLFLCVREPFGSAAALGAAGLLAVSPWHVLLSRTGYDWNLLPAMAALTGWLLTRALRRGAAFWAAGAAAGLACYTYAPIRVWLPLLLLLILVTHADYLRQVWRSSLLALVIAAALAAPVVAMTLTSEGRERLAAVAPQEGNAWRGARGFLQRFGKSFSPGFLFASAETPELHRMRSTGLLHGFEGLLIVAGCAVCLTSQERRGLLPLLACVAAPLAVAIHRDAPDPVLGAVMLPWLQGLGGVGVGWCIRAAARLRRGGRAALLACVALWVGASVARMSFDLYREFPVYSARAWGYGARQAVATLEKTRAEYDDVIVDTGEKLASSLILFYSRYDPRSRQSEIRELPGRAERSRVGVYRVTELAQAGKPGRHLAWTTADRARPLLSEATPIARIPFPDGSDNYVLLAVPRARGAP